MNLFKRDVDKLLRVVFCFFYQQIPSKHKIAEEMTSPRILKTHFAGPLLPPQLWEKKPKILYVIRNPKDLVVSMFHFRKLALPIPEFVNQSFGEFLHETISGDGMFLNYVRIKTGYTEHAPR